MRILRSGDANEFPVMIKRVIWETGTSPGPTPSPIKHSTSICNRASEAKGPPTSRPETNAAYSSTDTNSIDSESLNSISAHVSAFSGRIYYFETYDLFPLLQLTLLGQKRPQRSRDRRLQIHHYWFRFLRHQQSRL